MLQKFKSVSLNKVEDQRKDMGVNIHCATDILFVQKPIKEIFFQYAEARGY
jgi:hypothetical protein